jgi:hypothetical protein
MFIHCAEHGRWNTPEFRCPISGCDAKIERIRPMRKFAWFMNEHPVETYLIAVLVIISASVVIGHYIEPTEPTVGETPKVHEKTEEEFLNEFGPYWRSVYIAVKYRGTRDNPNWLIEEAIKKNQPKLEKEGLKPEQIRYFIDTQWDVPGKKIEMANMLIPFVKS